MGGLQQPDERPRYHPRDGRWQIEYEFNRLS